MLTDLGYRVLKAPDAASALAVVESGAPIDLLFTDVVMPGPLRSPEVARRAREHLPGLAVLFTSGYTENAIVHGGRLDEGVNLLPKPYSREALSRKFRHVLANQQQANAARAAQDRGGWPQSARQLPESRPANPLSILLVEDEEIIRLSSVDMLQELGHAVQGAASAEEAVKLLQNKSFDVLITDIQLPGRSGFALADEAQALQQPIGIVFASGRDQLPGEHGRAVLLRKPYDIAALAACLRKVGGLG